MAAPKLYTGHQVKGLNVQNVRLIGVHLRTADQAQVRRDSEAEIEVLEFVMPPAAAAVLGRELLSAANLSQSLNDGEWKED